MSEETPAPVLNVTEQVMVNHLLTYLIQYIAAVQHITDKDQLVNEILDLWELKFNQSVNIIKKATAETYADAREEEQDVWNIIVDASNMHIKNMSAQFTENVKSIIMKNLRLS